MTSPSASDDQRESVDLGSLLDIFYPQRGEPLAHFDRVAAESMPQAYRQLLDHDSHMTITVERFHGAAVEVRVQRVKETPGHYSREILLATRPAGRIVQYGIVRLRPEAFQQQVWQEIRAGDTPLGQVLINHDVFRQVELVSLWKVGAAPPLARLLPIGAGETTYGRTARIICDLAPAIELLEIVAPL